MWVWTRVLQPVSMCVQSEAGSWGCVGMRETPMAQRECAPVPLVASSGRSHTGLGGRRWGLSSGDRGQSSWARPPDEEHQARRPGLE